MHPGANKSGRGGLVVELQGDGHAADGAHQRRVAVRHQPRPAHCVAARAAVQDDLGSELTRKFSSDTCHASADVGDSFICTFTKTVILQLNRLKKYYLPAQNSHR